MKFQVGTLTKQWCDHTKIPCQFSESTTSTNAVAKEVHSESMISLVCTNFQTQGRGRSNHTWESTESGSQLLSTWVFRMSVPPHPLTSARVGLGLFNAAQSTWPYLDWSLKAPNDLFLGAGKVAGLLIENIQQGTENTLFIGLGLNVFKPPQLETATNLTTHINHLDETQWIAFLDRLLLEFSLAVANQNLQLDTHEQDCIRHALNKRIGIEKPYDRIAADGADFHTT